jgi:hypothetical protein
MPWVLVAFLLFTSEAYACSVAGVSNLEMVRSADAIIRATAVGYASPPTEPGKWTPGTPRPKVRFKVLENVRGPAISELVLPGILVNTDDFNDQPPPYTGVRPGGQGGNCFAESYRSGGQFLLFVKKTRTGEPTVYWYALAPVNEQLHSDDDPWLIWVRKEAHQAEGAPKR